MLETLRIPCYQKLVTTHGVQAISRKDSERSENPQRLYARPISGGEPCGPPDHWNGMRQSDLHGDMQSQTETIWPSAKLLGVTEINGPKVAPLPSAVVTSR